LTNFNCRKEDQPAGHGRDGQSLFAHGAHAAAPSIGWAAVPCKIGGGMIPSTKNEAGGARLGTAGFWSASLLPKPVILIPNHVILLDIFVVATPGDCRDRGDSRYFSVFAGAYSGRNTQRNHPHPSDTFTQYRSAALCTARRRLSRCRGVVAQRSG